MKVVQFNLIRRVVLTNRSVHVPSYRLWRRASRCQPVGYSRWWKYTMRPEEQISWRRLCLIFPGKYVIDQGPGTLSRVATLPVQVSARLEKFIVDIDLVGNL